MNKKRKNNDNDFFFFNPLNVFFISPVVLKKLCRPDWRRKINRALRRKQTFFSLNVTNDFLLFFKFVSPLTPLLFVEFNDYIPHE